MKRVIVALTILLNILLFVTSLAQTLPLVYNVENSGAGLPLPYLPSFSELPSIQPLPDPFMWADGRGQIGHFSDWEYRRAEISAQIQNYEIGTKPPRPDSITASYAGGVLTVNVAVNGQKLVLTSQVILPAGAGPFPAVIGMNSPSGSIPGTIFSSRNIAEITFSHDQVTKYGSPSNNDPYYKLYPTLNITNTGQYSAWAWGVSRIIDGLELTQATLPIDLKHIAVTGCSYAGKLALFAGALDERVALTIAQESGGGGATSWRYSHSLPIGTVEDIDNTDYNWFADGMKQFSGNNVSRLPEDHHELMALCAPRALYVTANPDYVWLSNPSSDVCGRAAQQVYAALDIPDRFGFSIIGGHSHCAVPDAQIPEISAFVDKFLLGKDTTSTNFSDSPYSIDLSPWITWTNPALFNGASYFVKTTLVSPPNLQTGSDTTITFKWNQAAGALQYNLQLANDLTFANSRRDSTTDTVKTITGLLKSKRYYWRVQIKGAGGLGPWSTVWQVTTSGPLPGKTQLIPVTTPDSSASGYVGYKFTWHRVPFADQYQLHIALDSLFIYTSTSTVVTDTAKDLFGFAAGQTYFWRVQSSNVLGAGPWSDGSPFPLPGTYVKPASGLPPEYVLKQNYPNPFNPTTSIAFALPKAGVTRISLYDLLGQEIRTVMNRELQEGYYNISVDAGNLASGIYFYRIQSGSFVQTKKMVLMK